jgi:Na+-transporting NADH:ubiquinone oxidoreductase subunit NqrF
MAETHELRIKVNGEEHVLQVADGANLRQTLLSAGLTPYTAITRVTNCGGRGICATCGVRFEAGEPAPVHWHDKLAARFGYPRLSCQIDIHNDMTIQIIPDKVIWGSRDPSRRYGISPRYQID